MITLPNHLHTDLSLASVPNDIFSYSDSIVHIFLLPLPRAVQFLECRKLSLCIYKAFGTESDSEDAGRDPKASLEHNPLTSETMQTMKSKARETKLFAQGHTAS